MKHYRDYRQTRNCCHHRCCPNKLIEMSSSGLNHLLPLTLTLLILVSCWSVRLPPFYLVNTNLWQLQYKLRLVASDNLNENYTTVVIHIKDVNDNPPAFDRPTYETQIIEEDDRVLPKRVLQVNILHLFLPIHFSSLWLLSSWNLSPKLISLSLLLPLLPHFLSSQTSISGCYTILLNLLDCSFLCRVYSPLLNVSHSKAVCTTKLPFMWSSWLKHLEWGRDSERS
jgi:hypothetical protein